MLPARSAQRQGKRCDLKGAPANVFAVEPFGPIDLVDKGVSGILSLGQGVAACCDVQNATTCGKGFVAITGRACVENLCL